MALDTDLTHYYNTDSNFNDSVGSYNGSDTNTPTYTSGKISNAFTCSSASSQYTSVNNGLFPWGTNTYTVNMWVKIATTSTNQSFTMTFRTTGKGLLLYVSGGMVTHSKPQIADLNYTWTADSAWHMWTFVGDGSGMRTYLDGNSTAVASNANTSNLTAPSTDTIEFGAYRSGGSIQAGWYLNGQLDEIGIWSRAITTAEISLLYNSGDGLAYPFPTTSIKSWNGLAKASIKNINGLAIASVKNINGLS